MAFLHGSNAKIAVNGRDLSPYTHFASLTRHEEGKWDFHARGYFDTSLVSWLVELPEMASGTYRVTTKAGDSFFIRGRVTFHLVTDVGNMANWSLSAVDCQIKTIPA